MTDDPILKPVQALLPLQVADEFRSGVAFWLGVLAEHEAVLAAVDLTEEDEPAPVFRA